MKKYSNFGWRVFGAIIFVSSNMFACPESLYDPEYCVGVSTAQYADFASQAGSAFELSPALLNYVAGSVNRPSQGERILSPQPIRPAILERPVSPPVAPSSPISPAACSSYITSPVARPCSVCGYKRPISPALVVASVRRVMSLPSLTR